MSTSLATPPPRRRVARAVRRIGLCLLILVLAVVLGAGGYVGYVAVRHVLPVALPAPTGTHPVGRVASEWTDHGRHDPFAARPGTPRRLAVWIWYPASRPGRPAPYAPGAWDALHFPGPLGLGETAFDRIRTHASTAVPVAPGRFPVVVLEPGMGLSAPELSGVAENLASHGDLVVGVTPTYSANVTVLHGRRIGSRPAANPPAFSAAAGDRIITTWAGDARFAAATVARLGRAASGRFAGHVDGDRVAYAGHSFGGATALQACSTDPHCRGAVDLDGTPYGSVVHRGLDVPFLVLGSENSCTTGTCRAATADDRASRTATRTLLAASRGPSWCFSVDGTGHFDFTDYAVYYLAAPLRSLVPLGSGDGTRALQITDGYLAAFSDHVLHGGSAARLDERPPAYHEVHALHRP